jgi:hypothetical protein
MNWGAPSTGMNWGGQPTGQPSSGPLTAQQLVRWIEAQASPQCAEYRFRCAFYNKVAAFLLYPDMR